MKNKTIKKALTTSIISILLCLAMFISTTFAWFTDSASTAVNKIQAGNLVVSLEMATAWDENGNPTSWESAEGKTLTFKTIDNRDAGNILWEPNCTYKLPELRISNNGDLALKYKVIISGIKGDARLNQVIDWIITLDGNTYVSDTEHSLETTDSDILTIQGHMEEDAGNVYQNQSIDGIAVTVVATQYTSESDSYNSQYDSGALYPNVEISSITEANNAIREGSNILLLNSDLNISDDSEGLTKFTIRDENDSYAALYFNKENTPNMAETITIDGTKTVKLQGKGLAVWAHHGANIVINGGTYDNSQMTSGYELAYANNDSTITIYGGTFKAASNSEIFNISNQIGNGEGGTIIIKGGLYNKPLIANDSGSTYGWQPQDTYDSEKGYGIKIADGYHYESVTIDGETWYQVVKNTTTD